MASLPALASSEELAGLAIRSVIVMLLAWLVVSAMFRASAAQRHLVWTLSLTSLLALPAFSLLLPAWEVDWLPGWHQKPSLTDSPVVEISPEVDETAAEIHAVIMPIAEVGEMAEVSVPAAMASSNLDASIPMATASDSATPLLWIVSLWAVGAVIALATLIVGLWQVHGLHRRSVVFADKQWNAMLKDLCGQLRIRRSVRLRLSDSAQVPLTFGFIRPVLLIPHDADNWSDDRKRMVLLHELAHIRRWDWVTQLLAHCACAAYWFHPLAWYAANRMRVERERACDDLVLTAGSVASEYARELLALAASMSRSRMSPLSLVAVPMARIGRLEDRLRGILDRRRSRRAVSVVAACLGGVIAIAASIPLAVLNAAQAVPETPDETEPAAEVERQAEAETQNEVPDPAQSIRITVLNAAGDQGIPEFRLIAGTPSGAKSRQFDWQPHTYRVGKDGDYFWPLEDAYKYYKEIAIRVEADGYEPQIYWTLKKDNGPQHIVFGLREDPGIAGRVVKPDGTAAANAIVALAIPRQEIVVENGTLRGVDEPLPDEMRNRWRRPRFFRTNDAGEFRLPTESEPAAVVIVHDSGVCEMPYGEWQKELTVTLKDWGRIEGQVLWQDTPGSNEELDLSADHDGYGSPGMVACSATTRSDSQGRFVFEKVLPGNVQISRPTITKSFGKEVRSMHACMYWDVTVTSGKPTAVIAGGRGRKVTGRFVGLDSWENATIHLQPQAPPAFPGSGYGGGVSPFELLRASSIGGMLFRERLPVAFDGTFSIEQMLPGNYEAFLTAPGIIGVAATFKITIPVETPGELPSPVVLQDIQVSKPSDVIAQSNKSQDQQQDDQKSAKRPSKTVTVRGKVVDDRTGEPVQNIIVQGGHFDPSQPEKVTWGYSESRSGRRDGSFSTTIRWDEGWTARIIADGYLSQPVITLAPPADKTEIEVEIRLKPGRQVRGTVLDHTGTPLRGAAVFAVGPTGVLIAAGQPINNLSGVDGDVHPVRTDENGRFETIAGDARSLAVSHAEFDAWPAEIPEKGDVTIQLPKPARVDVEMNIEGADQEAVVFLQLLTQGRKEFTGVRIEREIKITNPGQLTLPALPPGRYQICRTVMNRMTGVGMGAMLNRQFIELQAGESLSIDWNRKIGARVSGRAIVPDNPQLMGTIVSIRSLENQKDPFSNYESPLYYSSQTTTDVGGFRTERIPPGKYRLVAEAYVPLTPEQMFRSGGILPTYRAEVTIDVPVEGEVKIDDLVMQQR
ncbi:MAG: hypothetical protein KDA96_00200 [Planctomycetaceae bacterium]|nr:hypothetical protein [Planctomycetaceae bacterium]